MSAAFTEEQARVYMHKLLATMSQAGGSDLFIAADFAPSMKSQGAMKPLTAQKLSGEVTRMLARSLMTETQREEFEHEMECNFAISIPGVSRFRVNVLVQQRCVSMVIRTIASEIPNFEKLKLPEILKEVVMTKRGLVLVVGATGSGKSTSLAAMIDHRNRTSAGHIITVEDPVEYVHPSQLSLVTHREVGIDTKSWHHALKNTLRQAPDVILIGEIRDAETMEHAIAFAETGHLCLGTLHANSASQTIERIINFFPEERRKQLLMDLSANLRGIVSQRLVRREDGKGRSAAIEILLNTPTIAERIFQGEFHEIKGIMAKSRELGMCTFDAALFDLYDAGAITFEEAIRNADSANELRLNIKLKSKRGEPKATDFGVEAVTGTYSLDEVRRQRTTYAELVTRLGIRSGDYDQQLQKADQLRQRQGELENEMRKLRMQLVSGSVAPTGDEELLVDGIRVLIREVPPAPANELRDMADALRSKIGSGVVVIGTRSEGNVSLVVSVTKDLTARVKAGDLVKKLSAIVGGGGGGRPDFAQAGGKDPEKLPEALAAVEGAVREQLAR